MSPERRWFPVCRGEEAAPRHIVHTALLGQELAVWRADDGTVNAWENRCPHRGVRLSVGTNLGDRLKCRYHGWTYESGSGQCVERPAHPGEKPPSLVRAGRFPCVEVEGYVWVRLAGGGDDGAGTGSDPAPGFGPGSTPAGLTLRSIHVFAPAAAVADALARHAGEAPDRPPANVVESVHGAKRPRRGGRDPVRPSAGLRRRDGHPRRARRCAARGRADCGPSPRERPAPRGARRDRGGRIAVIHLDNNAHSGYRHTGSSP